jgi:hypothetical protein
MKNIINHSGITYLLSVVRIQDGNFYPFGFDAITPETKKWSYRLLSTDDKNLLTDETLMRWLRGPRSTLRADWEEQVGHLVGFITIHLPPKDGESQPQMAKFERGPDIDPSVKSPEPAPAPPPEPAPEMDGPDMF